MLENFIYAKKKSLFETALNNGEVLDEAIVFIEDTKEIWNHGTYFDGKYADVSNIEESIQNIINNKADKSFVEDNYYNKSTVDKKITEAVTGGQVSLDGFATEQWVNEQGFLKTHQDISHLAEKSELPTKVSELTNDSGFITIEDVPEVTVPTKVSELDNDLKFITLEDIPVLEIPDEYVTETELSNKGYATISALNNKVDKINGKQLSTEDFTTALKTKLEGLNNYDDTELSNAIETLRGDFDNIVSGDTTTAIKTFNEVIAFLDGLTDTQDLESIIASIEQQIAGKADNDSVVHIAGEETITGVKTFNGRVNFLGSGDSNAMYLSTNTRLNVNGTTNTVLGFSSGTFLINNAAYNLTLRGKGTRPTYNSTTLALSSDIPAAVTENTVSGWGFTKNTGTYSKPSTGIPKTDLASDVQTSLAKADTALQTETYKGTVTGVKVNGTTKNPSNGVVDLGTVITSHQDISGKQDTLVSGTNIKTINGKSILGEGNLIIEGGSSEANVQAVDTSETLDEVETNTYVKYVAQTLTEEQKAQARENIGVVENVDLSGYATKEDLNGKQDKLVSGTNIKTINGTSILGSGNIAISGGEGGSGTVNWNDISDNPIKIRYVDIQKHGEGLVLSEYTDIHVPISFYEDSTMFLSHCNGLECNYDKLYWDINKIKFIPENANTIDGSIVWEIHNTGDGTKFLSDNGQYKEVYTKTEIDTKLGDINSILESIING